MNVKLYRSCVRPQLPLINLHSNAKKEKPNARRLVENIAIKTDIKIKMILREGLVKNYLFKIYRSSFRVFTIDLKRVIQRSVQNLVNHLRWNLWRKLFTVEIP